MPTDREKEMMKGAHRSRASSQKRGSNFQANGARAFRETDNNLRYNALRNEESWTGLIYFGRLCEAAIDEANRVIKKEMKGR
jgi:hypothetical protein